MWYTFPTVAGFIKYKFTDEELTPIKTEINKIKNNFNEHTQANRTLAGNIKKEYVLEESKPYLQQLLAPVCEEYDKQFNYTQKCNVVSKKPELALDHCWVNFQQKHEFNPTHNHSGVLSFVLYINIPYSYEEEYNASPGINSNNPSPGSFDFVYSDCIAGLRTYKINIDKTMENTLLLFPSKLLHHVYPFFTKDDYRISVAGNFYVNTK